MLIETECDHGQSRFYPGVEYYTQEIYTRSWWRFFRKTYWRVCWKCDTTIRFEMRRH